jgi:ribosome-associated heat shock protein Hsp15
VSILKPGIRIDKWLWQARFFKTRGLAAKLVKSGKLRINGSPVSKPARTVSVADILTFPKEDYTRVIEIYELGKRRGPAPEAQALYHDLSPLEKKSAQIASPSTNQKPTSRDRRALKKFKDELQQK